MAILSGEILKSLATSFLEVSDIAIILVACFAAQDVNIL